MMVLSQKEQTLGSWWMENEKGLLSMGYRKGE